MNSWNPQPQQQQQFTMGQAQLNPYMQQPNFNMYGNRAPSYRADPIHGENAAWQFPIGSGEIYLPDADEDIIWWIRVDQNGNKQVVPFDVTPHQKPAQVDINTILARLNAIEEKVNGKQNKSNAKRSQPAPAPTATIDESVN